MKPRMRLLNGAKNKAIFEKWKKVTNTSGVDGLNKFGNLLARSHMTQTQPFGNGSAAKKQGQNAVRQDIYKALRPVRFGYKDILNKLGEPSAKAFWQLMKADKLDEAAVFLRKAGLCDNLKQEMSAAVHQATRSGPRKRVKATGMYVINGKKIDRYAKQIQKHVGYGKSGWLTAASILGKVPGPSWVKKNQGPGSAIPATEQRMSVTVINEVPYIGQILNAKQKRESEEIILRKFVNYMKIAIRDIERKASQSLS